MKKLFAIIFTVCFVLGGCQKGQPSAPETNSVNESTISESFDDKSQSPATNRKRGLILASMRRMKLGLLLMLKLKMIQFIICL